MNRKTKLNKDNFSALHPPHLINGSGPQIDLWKYCITQLLKWTPIAILTFSLFSCSKSSDESKENAGTENTYCHRPQLEGGKIYKLSMVKDETITQNLMGTDFTLHSQTFADISAELTSDANHEKYLLKMKVSRMGIKITGAPFGTIDTEDPGDSNPIGKLVNALAGKEFFIPINPEVGKSGAPVLFDPRDILNVALDSLNQSSLFKDPYKTGNLPKDLGSLNPENMIQNPAGGAIPKDLFKGMNYNFPKDCLKKGDHWTDSDPGIFPLIPASISEITFDGKDEWGVRFTIKEKFDSPHQPANSSGNESTFFTEGESEGKFWLDPTTSWVRKMESEIIQTWQVKIMGVTMSLVSSGKVNITGEVIQK